MRDADHRRHLRGAGTNGVRSATWVTRPEPLLEGPPAMFVESGGRLDPSFGSAGKIRTAFPDGANSLALEPDGGVLVGGEGDRLVRLLPDGSVDPSFGEGGVAAMPPLEGFSLASVTVRADGTILVGGDSHRPPNFNSEEFVLARLTPEGRLDPSFGPGTGFVTADGTGLAVERRKGVYVSGYVGECKSRCRTTRAAVFRLDPDGHLDPGFGQHGAWSRRIGTSSRLLAIALGRGSIVAAGLADRLATSRDLLLVRLHH